MLKKFMEDSKKWPYIPVLAVLVLGGLVYGVFVPKLGFYWDDWSTMLIAKLLPPAAYWKFYSFDRPFSAWSFYLLGPLFGTVPVYWHILSLLLKIGVAVGLAALITVVWPRRRFEAGAAALLFLVYPLFMQQPISVDYHRHWIAYLLFILSLWWMVLAFRNPRKAWLWTSLAVLAELLHLSLMEYFLGVELLRPLILLCLFYQQTPAYLKSIWLALKSWLPYLLVVAVFIAWRLYFSTTLASDPNQPKLFAALIAHPLTTFKQLAGMAWQDVYQSVLGCWVDAARLLAGQHGISANLTLAVIAALAACLLLALTLPKKTDTQQDHFYIQAILISLAGLILAFLPIWVTNRQMAGTQFSDRFGLPALFLAALLWGSLASLLFRSSRWSVVLIFVLIFLGGFRQADEQGKYQIAWVEQKDFSWQLAWRAPAIQTHTAVVSDDQIYPFSRRVFGLNLIYPQPKSGVELPLWNYNLWQEEWLNQDFLKNSQDLSESYRQFWFKGSTKDLLIVHAENGQCLWLLQPLDALDPQLAENMRSLAAYSNISLVQNARASSQPPAEIFGEPALNSWCYDYEKAALGSQQKDWQAVITLQGATQKSGFSPDNPISASPHEWAPFMQAQAASGNQVEAESMLNQLLARHPEYRAYLCAAWNEVAPIPASCAKP